METDHDGRVEALGAEEHDEIVDVLAEAFSADPIVRYVLGEAETTPAAPLRTLVGFFVGARVLRGEPMLGVRDGPRLAAAALVSFPWNESPAELHELRSEAWAALGAAARERYERMGRAWGSFEIGRPHVFLNMIGVRRSHRRLGHGRRLVAAVADLSREQDRSEGVALVTEGEVNLRFYAGLGYVELARAELGKGLEMAMLFRADGG